MAVEVRIKPDKGREPRLKGWQLVVAIAVVGVIAVLALWIAPEVALALVEPFVRTLG